MRRKDDYRTLLETPPVIADPEQLTQKLTLINLALAGLSLLHGKALDAELLPIQQTVGDALLLAEAIEEAGVRPPSAPDVPKPREGNALAGPRKPREGNA
jgi:hypothetical protein